MRTLLLFAAALAACEAARPPPCPGSPVATFDFTVTLADGGSSCAIDAGPPLGSSWSAILAWDPADGGAAALCIQRPYAQPFLGTHVGDQISVQSTLQDNTIASCGCADGGTITIQQVVNGNVLRGDGGAPVSFSGTEQDQLSAGSGDSCGCGLPCVNSYALAGTR